MKCDACKYAIWRKTAAGRLHPDKSGQCGYKKLIPMPASNGSGWYGPRVDENRNIIVEGGYIERGWELSRKCAYYGPIKGGK